MKGGGFGPRWIDPMWTWNIRGCWYVGTLETSALVCNLDRIVFRANRLFWTSWIVDFWAKRSLLMMKNVGFGWMLVDRTRASIVALIFSLPHQQAEMAQHFIEKMQRCNLSENGLQQHKFPLSWDEICSGNDAQWLQCDKRKCIKKKKRKANIKDNPTI